ncbi:MULTISPECIES: saccharopine dehydrogenase [unclassified Streptomyces]|uniref:saccharopine dehydrogenase n=1 Tax=unclassified Streptomyces TaxID=2593676 RepID=UPI00109E3F0B|nr:saccharopine dehydrogenase [Streptomyces sp. A1136]THA44163.1 saccharopine dehydrogenase [Streptomyces sp. A1136]
MPESPQLWMRTETRPTERRAPLTPHDADQLVRRGVRITVEESAHRVFPLADYADAGCGTAPAGAWATDAPGSAFVLGLKELPPEPERLRHRHVYFGHAYKGQAEAPALLRRFAAGGGTLFDLEYLADEQGRRLAAFGYWAGYAGAALAVLHARGRLAAPLVPLSRAELDARLRDSRAVPTPGGEPRALVIGGRGRSARGACDALRLAGVRVTRWDRGDTARLDRAALLGHDILVNAVLTTRPAPPFLTPADLDPDRERRLTVIADITCDTGSPLHRLPVYDRLTDWSVPVRRLRAGPRPLDVIAIDNLPSLVPEEAARSFSADLLPKLLALGTGTPDPDWTRCRAAFTRALAGVGRSADRPRRRTGTVMP